MAASYSKGSFTFATAVALAIVTFTAAPANASRHTSSGAAVGCAAAVNARSDR